MKHSLIMLGFVLAACAAPAAPTVEPTAAPTSTPTVTPWPTLLPGEPLFTLGDAPAYEHGALGDYVFTGPVIEHDGVLNLFYTNFEDPQEIGLATSTDGVMWESTPAALLSSEDFTNRGSMTDVSVASVLPLNDGTWAMYLSIWEPLRDGEGALVRATAPDIAGPWMPDAGRLLEAGSSGEWDSQQLFNPSVVKMDDGYIMFYAAIKLGQQQGIGMATSPDGTTWTKYNDPATTDAPYAESDPVLLVDPDQAWEAEGLTTPSVQRVGDHYVMLYTAVQPSGERSFGLAFSDDGITWQRHPDNPIFTPDDIPLNLFLHSATLFCPGDNCAMLIEIVDRAGGFSDLWIAPQAGALQ
jgi:hypothetical protein